VRPRSCPTLRSVPLVSSRPDVTAGRCLLAGSGRCAGRRRGCEPRSPTPLASAGRKALLRCRSPVASGCCQRACPDAPMGLFLKRAGEDASVAAGRTSRTADHDRNRSPGRTRVHPAFRPRSDLDGGATGPRQIRRIQWGSARPGRSLATALRRSRSGGIRSGGVASPRLVSASVLRQQPAASGRPIHRFLFP
jgi:hypothetical protein